LEFGRLDYVATWLATTGAAFSSAMGRMSLGSTNAFMAAVNADLGIWLPNLTMLQEEGALCPNANEGTKADSVTGLPRPRFAYILKEILGWYDTHDRFVFITDGGHWDNLGLVELLRRDCDIIYCVDASGDPPGSFATLRQSLDLAALELGCKTDPVDLEKDFLKGMLPPKTGGGLPAKLATTFTVKRAPGARGAAGSAPAQVTIRYMKLQSAQAMSPDLKRWAIADPKFPHYSTMRQFLTNDQFEKLVALGREAGAAALALDVSDGGNRQ
jgi:hypothetical protein